MSSSESGSTILEPKPPVALGHRNAIVAAPNAPRPMPKSWTMPRLRNWRRVTPSVSGSSGTRRAGGAGGGASTTARSCSRSSTAARSTSRPVRRAAIAGSASSGASRSRRRVSRVSSPTAVRRSRRAAVVSPTVTSIKSATGTAMATTVPADISRPPSEASEDESQIEDVVDPALPGEDEVEAGAPEERADDHEHGPEHHEHEHHRDGELAVLRLVA